MSLLYYVRLKYTRHSHNRSPLLHLPLVTSGDLLLHGADDEDDEDEEEEAFKTTPLPRTFNKHQTFLYIKKDPDLHK